MRNLLKCAPMRRRTDPSTCTAREVIFEPASRPAILPSPIAPIQSVRRGRNPHSRSRHRLHHRHLQRLLLRPPSPAGLPRSRSQRDGQRTGQANPLTLGRQSYSVIGILPKGYELLSHTPVIVIAMGPWAAKLPDDRSWHPGSFAIARLKPSVPLANARAEMSTIARRLYEKYPNDIIALDAVVNPMHEQLVSQARPALVTHRGAVIFVLLIASGSIANQLLTRATAR